MTNTLSRRLSKLEAVAEPEALPIGAWFDPGRGWIIRGEVVAAEHENPPSHFEGRPVIPGAWMDGGLGQ